ncbi:Serine/threonine-protein kinase Sgk2 [Coemansia spiralis]|uniref:Serine/threonine-protein kinase Sgk2 n=1 Tax=Coemansia spiralis TaxID=417178 RepID=A0A9W8KXH3_9FUNG|nr:Serine/threonine-protein kinase Sgk2 [Coemansia spiralis]
MDAGANMPSALRHLLARGAQQQPQPHQQQQQYASDYNLNAYNTYSHNSAASSATTLQQQAVNTAPHQKLSSAKSMGNLKTGSGGSLGAWLSKYHLRSNNKPSSSLSDHPIISGPTNGRTISSSPSPNPITGPAQAAYITSVETRESNATGGPGEPLRMGGLRMGRKRYLVYRILVSGRIGQWWVARRYSEFHDLYQNLRRMFPQTVNQWDEFPSKRLLPGLSSSADSVLQRRERLNTFLRTLTQIPQICQCSVVQRFLRDDPIDADLIPLADRTMAEHETKKQNKYGGIELVIHSPQNPHQNSQQKQHQQQQHLVQQQNKRSVSSGSALPGSIDNPALYAQWGVPVPEKLSNEPDKRKQPPLPPMEVASQARESLERMVSMPSLKSAGAVPDRPNFDFSIPLPQNPLFGGFSSLGTATGRDVNLIAQHGHDQQSSLSSSIAAPIPMHRKISDPQEYASAEKRPSSVNPLSMRKKYGMRRNVQYRNDRPDFSNGRKKSGSGSSSSHAQIPLPHPLPDTAKTLLESQDWAGVAERAQMKVSAMNWESDYVMVDDDYGETNRGVNGNAMDVDSTLRGGSMDSEASSDMAPSTKRGRNIVVLRRAPLGGIEKQRRVLAEDDPAMISAKKQLRSAKRQQSAPPEEPDSDEDDERRNKPKAGAPQKVSLDDFHLLSIIGKGSYGQVMLARYKDTGKVMAIKVISKSKLRGRPNEIRRVMSERKVLERTVKHPFLVGLQCAFQTKEKLFFCLDYVNGGELFFHLQRERRFGENRARFYAAEIACALEYLHGMGVVYRDLKPENCLLDADGHVKIVDFGLAKEVGPVVWRTEGSALYSVEEGGKTGTFCGTPEYLAPEVLLRQRYGKEVDWYCLGAVLYEMLTGLPPFYDQDNSTMYQRILAEDLRFPTVLPPPAPSNGTLHPGSGNVATNVIGRYAQDFVFRLMDRNPKTRLGHGVFGTENVKRHVFFHGIDWGKIYRQEYAPPFVPKVSSIFDLSNIDPEFRNEPIPESIFSEGQVDISAEAAEAERQAELELHAQLMAFPSPVTSPTARKLLANNAANGNDAIARALFGDKNLVAAMLGKRNNADVDSTIDAFRGFSFVSPYVDTPDSD